MKIPAARVYFPPEDIDEFQREASEVLRSGMLTLGSHTKAFEEAFAAHVGARHAVAVSSGTAALEIPLRALGVHGREVIVPTNTFFATPAAVIHARGIPVFADVDAATLAIDLESTERHVSVRTAGVVVVHIGGIVPPYIEELRSFCERRGLFLVEDAAHAHGSGYDGRAAGTFGKAAAYSFYPTKVMTSGEGGMIVTDDETIYNEALIYRDQGKASFTANFHTHMGHNWRMSEIHAILGLLQLRRLPAFLETRARMAAIYDQELEGAKRVRSLRRHPRGAFSHYKYIAMLEAGVDRKALKATLRERHGVSLSGEVYDVPCHRQPVFEPYTKEKRYPVADDVCARHICLPLYATMTEDEARHVARSLREVLGEA